MIKAGDIFLVHKGSFFTWAIRQIEKAQARDGEAYYSHAGIFLDSLGTTFEALLHVRSQNFFQAYAKTHSYMIIRHREMTSEKFSKGWKAIKEYEGNFYPAHRLFLFLVPILADKINVFDWGVCSELAAKHWYAAELLDSWSGTMPSDLEDMGRYWNSVEIIKEHRV